MITDKQQSNVESVKQAANELISEVLDQLKRNDFFTTSMTITVQNGTVRTAKKGTETCTNFVTQPSRS
jgi:hypothetical protein